MLLLPENELLTYGAVTQVQTLIITVQHAYHWLTPLPESSARLFVKDDQKLFTHKK